MKTQIIKAIFTNLLFVVGIILIIMGFTRGVSTVVKTIVFEKYPLDSYEEIRCEVEVKPVEDKQKCFERIEQSRRVRQVEDITNSITFFVSGAVLAYIFKRFIFTKA